MASSSASEKSIASIFDECELVVSAIDEGNLPRKELEAKVVDAEAKLAQLGLDISALDLFSTNEFIEELPTSSVRMLLLPCYRAVCLQNMPFSVNARIDYLKAAKINFMEFLQRLQDYEVISFQLPWKISEDADESELVEAKIVRAQSSDIRAEKLRRHGYDKSMQEALLTARLKRKNNPDDESALREIYLIQIRQWALRALSELESIDSEIPFAKMRAEAAANGTIEERRPELPKRPLQVYTITRSEAQKKVFGLGYPSIPTMTVDEWAANMQISGAWGGHGHSHGSTTEEEEAAKRQADLNDSEKEDEVDPEELRQKQMRFDDFKDTHRWGSGNTHNKG